MSAEIELKAHLEDDAVDDVVCRLKSMSGAEYLGEVRKYDIYWSHTEEGDPEFRTRQETALDASGCETHRIIFTQKPMKRKDYSTEYNVENEFEAAPGEWKRILAFIAGIGLVACRIKEKEGFHFRVCMDGQEMHSEILNVKHLGWFIETEICGDDIDAMDKKAAERALYALLRVLGISETAVEPRGYNKMLKAAGHERG